jgi:hypothetical protein
MSQENVEVVRRSYEANNLLGRTSTEFLDPEEVVPEFWARLAPDCELHERQELPDARTYRGPAAAKEKPSPPQHVVSRAGDRGRAPAEALRPEVLRLVAPAWKRAADFLFVQVSWSVPELLDWRSRLSFEGPVFAGVLVPSSATMARKLSADTPELTVPDHLIAALDVNPEAGVDFASRMVHDIRESGAFDGVHLIPVSRYRQIAARLEP